MKQCKKCGEIKPLDSFYKNNNRMKDGRLNFCSQCFEKKRKEREAKYGISTRTITTFGLKLALFVYDRAHRKCEKCKQENDLTVHHKDGNGRHNKEKGLPVNNHPDNLQVLCRRCHGGIHGKEGAEKRREKKHGYRNKKPHYSMLDL